MVKTPGTKRCSPFNKDPTESLYDPIPRSFCHGSYGILPLRTDFALTSSLNALCVQRAHLQHVCLGVVADCGSEAGSRITGLAYGSQNVCIILSTSVVVVILNVFISTILINAV